MLCSSYLSSEDHLINAYLGLPYDEIHRISAGYGRGCHGQTAQKSFLALMASLKLTGMQ